MSQNSHDAAPAVCHYRMPAIAIGSAILWYPNAIANEQPYPALVTYIGQNCISIAVVEKDADILQPRVAVRHMKDPTLSIPESRVDGAWDYTERDKLIFKLREALIALAGDVGKDIQSSLE